MREGPSETRACASLRPGESLTTKKHNCSSPLSDTRPRTPVYRNHHNKLLHQALTPNPTSTLTPSLPPATPPSTVASPAGRRLRLRSPLPAAGRSERGRARARERLLHAASLTSNTGQFSHLLPPLRSKLECEIQV